MTDSYSTISDHRTLSEDSEDQYNYQAQSQQVSLLQFYSEWQALK